MHLIALVALISAAPPADSVLAFGRVPMQVGVAAGLDGDRPTLHLYAPTDYTGHANFVSRGRRAGVTFAEFKRRVRDPRVRRWLPFFLYDVSGSPLTRDGTARTWALQLEDYAYTDTPAELTAAVARLAGLVRAARGAPGVVILARSDQVRPNTSMAPDLLRAGVATCELRDVLAAAGAPRLTVLTPGTAVGTLRLATQDDTLFGPGDVVVFPSVPDRVPPVAGIVTLAPRTPLSHLSLLARSRGTVDVAATSLADLPGAEALVGRLIRLTANAKLVAVRPISAADAARWRARHPRRAVTIPAPSRGDVLVELASAPGVELVGAKAANYALLRRLLPELVRPAAAIGFGPYLDLVASTGADRRIATFLAARRTLDAPAVKRELAAIRKAIRSGRLPQSTLAAVRGALPGVPKLRLRSSTNCEDLPDFNGAGLYDSEGFRVADDDATLERKLLRVYASLWRREAFLEREWAGIDHARAAMAVLVSPAFEHELCNGVVVTVPRADGGADVVMNAQLGDRLVTNPTPGDVPEELRWRLGRAPPSQASARPVLAPPSPYAVLLPRIADAVTRIHRDFTDRRRSSGDATLYGVDIELKVIEGPALVIKQARLLAAPRPY